VIAATCVRAANETDCTLPVFDCIRLAASFLPEPKEAVELRFSLQERCRHEQSCSRSLLPRHSSDDALIVYHSSSTAHTSASSAPNNPW
jgi:hypothetical protein